VWPLTAGGEGTVEALVQPAGRQLIAVRATGLLGLPIMAQYGLLDQRYPIFYQPIMAPEVQSVLSVGPQFRPYKL